jgi:hypothetical protein
MRKRWLFAVGLYLVLVTTVAIGIGSINLLNYRRLANEGTQIVGAITTTECQNHNLVRYSFEVGGQQYEGMGGSPGNCGEFAPGDPVEVWYVPDDPNINLVGSARGRYRNELISVSMASIIVPGVLTLVLMVRWSRRR